MSFRFAAKQRMLHNSVRSMPDKVAVPECVRAPLLGQRTGCHC